MSDLDEDFGNFMAFLSDRTSPEGSKLWEERLVGIKRNQRKLAEIISSIITRPQIGSDGAIVGFEHGVTFSPRKFEPIYDKCFRALYFDKYQRVYPVDFSFDYFYPRDLSGMHQDFLEHLFTRNIGANHIFYCGVAHTDESEDVFAALLLFYERLAVVGMTSNLESFKQFIE